MDYPATAMKTSVFASTVIGYASAGDGAKPEAEAVLIIPWAAPANHVTLPAAAPSVASTSLGGYPSANALLIGSLWTSSH